MSQNVCNACSKVFVKRCTLLRHQRDKHGVYVYNCEHCKFGCNMKSIFCSHLQNIHNFVLYNVEPRKAYQKRILCPTCEKPLSNYKGLDDHLSSVHSITNKKEEFTFSKTSEFRKWKEKLERESRCEYSADTAQRSLKLKNCIRKVYFCHRSYKPQSRVKPDSRKRAMKSSGSNKIGFSCPSRMIVNFVGKTVKVEFFREHVGHICELIRTKIPSDDRAKIAGKLQAGLSFERVLDHIRNTATGENVERVHYVEKKDLHNILRDFKIEYHTLRYHEDGTISLDKIERIQQSHMRSKDIKDDDVEPIESDGNLAKYYVKSQSVPDLKYQVTPLREVCPESPCILQCSECNVCVHNYSCTCSDNVIDANICKHIHKVCTVIMTYTMNRGLESFVEENYILIQGDKEIAETAISQIHESRNYTSE